MLKHSIKNKIIYSYVSLVVASLAIMGACSLFAIKTYTFNEAKQNLKRNAAIISELAGGQFDNTKTINEFVFEQLLRDRIRRGMGVNIFGSSLAIVTRDGTIMLPRTGEEATFIKNKALPSIWDKLSSKKAFQNSFVYFKSDGIDYMCSVFPSDVLFVLLYIPITDIQGITKNLYIVILAMVALSGLVAALAGRYLARKISDPIISIKNSTNAIARRKFDKIPVINTGDELEDLAGSIGKMSEELKNYDLSQKIFLQNVSHELKTPLMSIQGYAEGIKDGVFKENNIEQALSIIVEESVRLKNIVEELVYLTKVESMDGFLKPDFENVGDLIKNSVSIVKGIALSKDVDVEIIDCEDVFLTVDSDKLHQALLNILGNCIRHAVSKVDIIAGVSRIKNNHYEIKISDDGPGFTEDDFNNAFKRFYKGKKGSTGLGLAITKAIVEKHGGDIEISNKPEGGAVYLLYLPLSAGEIMGI